MKLYYAQGARRDIESAFEWYEKQKQGLGFDFLDSIEYVIKNILEYPEMYPISHAKFRKCVIRKFPFSIFYTTEDQAIIIHAVFDNRQDQKKQPK